MLNILYALYLHVLMLDRCQIHHEMPDVQISPPWSNGCKIQSSQCLPGRSKHPNNDWILVIEPYWTILNQKMHILTVLTHIEMIFQKSVYQKKKNINPRLCEAPFWLVRRPTKLKMQALSSSWVHQRSCRSWTFSKKHRCVISTYIVGKPRPHHMFFRKKTSCV